MDPEGTKERLDFDAEMTSDLSDHDFFDRDKIDLLICDEQDLLGMSKKQRGAFDRLVSYDATHKSLSIFICQQNVTNCPPSVRRACDYICYWPGIDRCAQEYMTRLTGHSIKKLKRLCETRYDFLCFDFGGIGPELRLNIFERINVAESDDDD